MEKSTQIFTITKYQKNVLNLFVHLWFWLILILEQVKELEIPSDFDKENSDKENSNEQNSVEENSDKN